MMLASILCEKINNYKVKVEDLYVLLFSYVPSSSLTWICDKNTWSRAIEQLETALSACRYPTSLPCSHRLPCLCRGRNLLSLSAAMALIWPREITPPAEKHKRRQERDQYMCPRCCFFLPVTSMAFSPHTLHNMQAAAKHPNSCPGTHSRRQRV
jgi:hypothetical protein